MTNLFTPTTNDSCILTINDVKDSLGVPYTSLTDAQINILILDATSKLFSYLSYINSSITCDNIDCDTIPLNIKRAALYILKSIYESRNVTAPVIGGIDTGTLKAGDVYEESSCDTTIKYYAGNRGITLSSDTNPCDDIPCEATNLLECYRVTGFSLSLCPDICSTNECKQCL